jgi:acyl-CoA dehydrogenase
MYFEMATRDIRALPKLEGTVHVNIALIVKFMPSYFFNHAAYPAVPRRDDARNDDFLFDQGPARGLGNIAFHDYATVFASWDLPNVRLFRNQVAAVRELVSVATPDEAQRKDLDFVMALGEIFVLVVYAELVLENARLYAVDDGLVDQIFDGMVRDLSRFALQLYGKPSTTPAQMDLCLRMIRKPAADEARYERVWREYVYALRGAYRMND